MARRARAQGCVHSGLPQYSRAAARMLQLACLTESGEAECHTQYCALETSKERAAMLDPTPTNN